MCELFDETVEGEFSGFVEDDDEVLEVESEDEILDPLLLPTQQVRNMNNNKTEVVPEGWDINKWNVGGTHLNKQRVFSADPGLNINIPNEANECFFLNLC